jgi:hypothetical protein
VHLGRHSAAIVPAVAGTLAVCAAGLVTWHASAAAFSSTTSNTGNGWSAATVSLTDDDSGAAIFAVTGAEPGDTGRNCITVTFTGTTASTVRAYASGLTGTLGPYLNLTVEQGTGGSFGNCTGFTAQASTTGTLASFASTYTGFTGGFGTWAPTAAGDVRTYRISWSLAANNVAAGKSAALAFTWEARNT